jgi:hypothetical protein
MKYVPIDQHLHHHHNKINITSTWYNISGGICFVFALEIAFNVEEYREAELFLSVKPVEV